MEEERLKQILILATDLLGETLSIQIANANPKLKVVLNKQELTHHPSLVIWSIDNTELPNSINIELNRLKERWSPSPILIILPEKIRLTPTDLLQFESEGLLQGPDLKTLNKSIETIINGGRVFKIKEKYKDTTSTRKTTLGLGQWLLISGVQQINDDLEIINFHLDPPPENIFSTIILLGRKRELKKAKSILNYLWGPMQVAIENIAPVSIKNNQNLDDFDLDISLTKKDPIAVWQEIYKTVEFSIQGDLKNSTGNLLALEGIKSVYKKDLLLSLLNQVNQVIEKLRVQKNNNVDLNQSWTDLQNEIRQQALRSIIGNYIRLPLNGKNTQVAEELILRADLSFIDEELPNPGYLLNPLILNSPVSLDGQIFSTDDPRALIHLQLLLTNWLIRTAEIVSAEIISISSEWPEFRHYLLNKQLISTRELERLRNQLNSQNQLQNLIKKPIRIYESKRLLYTFKKNQITTIIINEPRDEELRKLGWWQQQVALLVETRDALAPQIQSLIKYMGDLMVVVLTKVIGRAIGLVGKGIAQGMGRTINKG